jgi:hypothetical protein
MRTIKRPIEGQLHDSITSPHGTICKDGVPLRCIHCDDWLTLDHVADAHGRPCRTRPPRRPNANKASIVAQESANGSTVESSPGAGTCWREVRQHILASGRHEAA